MTPAQRREWRLAVLGHRDLSPRHRLVLLALHETADYADGTNAWPGNDKLAAMCGVDRATATRGLTAGVALRLIERTANARRGRNAVYRLLPVPDGGAAVHAIEADGGAAMHPIEADGGAAMHQLVAQHCATSKASPDPERGARRSATSPARPTTGQHNLPQPPAASERTGDQQHAAGPFGPRCTKHRNDADPPGCWDCKRAADRGAVALAADNAAVRKAIDDCHHCDDYGRLDDLTPCPEHPSFRRDSQQVSAHV